MRPARAISIAFLLSILGSVGLVAVYLLGGQPQLEGILLAVALGGLGLGIAVWCKALLEGDEQIEERKALASLSERSNEPQAGFEAAHLTRRSLLVRLLLGAGGALAGALALPTLSLGPRPGQSLFGTAWRDGAPVVDGDGNRIRPEDIGFKSVLTVFPEGHEGSADAQTLLLRVEEDLLELPVGREGWVVNGAIAFSKICPHAGCPVGLYRAEAHELLCPCHQSTFAVLRGAVPTFGPADRPLPQLPLAVDDQGYLIATGDFSAPVGPGFWNIYRGDKQ